MNEENILIIGDDLAGQPNVNPSTPAQKPDTTANEGSWLAGRKDHLAETFLEKHKAEFQEHEQREWEKMKCADRFRALKDEITSRRLWLDNLRNDLAEYQAADVPGEIFKNMQRTGRPLLEIAQSSLFPAVVLIKEHGKKILHLAEKELADLEKKFNAFKDEKREALAELGLI
jgi:hypothetical protein